MCCWLAHNAVYSPTRMTIHMTHSGHVNCVESGAEHEKFCPHTCMMVPVPVVLSSPLPF